MSFDQEGLRIAHVLGWTALHLTWMLLLLRGIVALLRPSPSRRHGWALAAFFCMPLLALCVAVVHWRVLDEVSQGASVGALLGSDALSSINVGDEPPATTRSLRRDEARSPWPPIVAGLWVIGTALLLLRVGAGLLWLRRWHRLLLAEPEPKELRALARRLTDERTPALRWVEPGRPAPALLGLLRPLIALPDSLRSKLLAGEEREARAVLRHELAHHRARDPWVLLLQRLVEAVLFFHPVTWALSRRLDLERECRCDRVAVAGDDPRVYAQLLLRLADARQPRLGTQLFMARGDLLKRIQRLVSSESPRMKTLNRRLFISLAASLALAFLFLNAVEGVGASELFGRDLKRRALQAEALQALHPGAPSGMELPPACRSLGSSQDCSKCHVNAHEKLDEKGGCASCHGFHEPPPTPPASDCASCHVGPLPPGPSPHPKPKPAPKPKPVPKPHADPAIDCRACHTSG